MSARNALLPLLVLAAPFAGAATIAHWKFDTGSPFADSAGTNTLSNNNATTTFTNGSANFTGGGSSGQLLSAANIPAWTDTSFTVESVFTPTTLNTGGPSTIVAHLADPGGGRQWLFGVDLNGNLALLTRNGDGAEAYFINATALPKIVNGQSYYVAAAVDLTDSVAANRITLYVQNLTAGGALVSANTANTPLATLAASTAALTIGSTGHSSARLNGSISEIRISDTKLTSGELLIPEPSVALLSAAGIIFLLRRRH